MITKKDNLKLVSDSFPEVGQVLAEYGLHCVGCHVSAMENIEDGCKAHGLSDKKINELVGSMNKQVKLFDSLPDLEFSSIALSKLKQKLSKNKCKYIRIMPIFGGFDFDATNKKNDSEIVLEKGVPLLLNEKVRRFLKGVKIDFDEKQKDFVAKRD